ncbi:MAG: 2-oxo acid dehydrogenase subunit E2 [Phycisphaerales bacterium]|nr:MAG: 2-oxo acid dehydrogenase subunit E2 [Phycisphaerales bacterium]
MPIEVTMPRLSDTMEQGTVVKWHVAEGDTVETGQVLADIETDKATMELESFDTGTVAKIAAAEGTQVAVGSLIMVIAEEGEDAAEAAKSAGGSAGGSASGGAEKKAKADASDEGGDDASNGATATATETEDDHAPAANGHPRGASGDEGGRIFVSPLARKMAEDEGIDLAALTGSGPSGRIVRKDIEAAIAKGGTPDASKNDDKATKTDKPRSAPAPMVPDAGSALESRSIPVSGMRATIAKRLLESTQQIPHYYVTVQARMDELLNLRKQLNAQLESQGVKLSVNDFIIRACGLAMHQHPYVNSRWIQKDGQATVELVGEVNIGMAIALEREGGGLVVGTIRHADRVGLRQISSESKRLATKAREKGLSPEDMADQTFTISSLGMFGVRHYTAIINPPNTAILAVGAATATPVVNHDGSIAAGHVMDMTLSSDHRVIDGAMAAKYLNTVREYLEHPATLLV